MKDITEKAPMGRLERPDVVIRLSAEGARRYWTRVTAKTAKRIEPYTKARVRSHAEASSSSCG